MDTSRRDRSDDPFPPQAAIGTTHFVAGGAEYKWTGIEWSATGVTNWRVIATVPFYTVAFNVTALDGRALEVMHNYQFRVSAGNLNSRSFGPAAVVTRAMPVPPPGPAREVVVSNPRITQFALNFVPPLVTNITGPSTMYRVMVTETVTGYTYEYHEVLTVTSTLASGFLPGTSYTVTIFAGNLGGFDKIGSRSTRFVKTLATPCTTACCEVPPPLPRTNRTSLVPLLVLSGHAASLTPCTTACCEVRALSPAPSAPSN